LASDGRRVLLIALLLIGYFGIEMFLVCYRLKTPWYSSNFWPPGDYIKGPIMRDQGTNI
jgi:hypothetical protein